MGKLLLRTLFVVLFGVFSISAGANCPTINSSFTTSVVSICGPGPNTISFVNTSTGGGAAGATYEWFLNGAPFDTTAGLVAPATSTISAIGTYTFMVVANGPAGCLDTAINTVRIFPIPVASFTFTPNNQCAGNPVAFTNTSTGTVGVTTYLWNFGDATTSTQQNPTHVYAAGGTYNVTLTVTNFAGCSSTFNLSVTALAIPFVSIFGDDGDGDTQNCLLPGDPTTSEVVTFTNFTTGAVSYTWDYGDGSPTVTTGSNAALTHTYNTYGTFTVTMTATGPNGCTATDTIIVIFERYVGASFSVPIAQMSGCLPLTVTPVNASQNATTYTWNFGDGSPVIVTNSFTPPTHTYTVAGTYVITLVASNSCNSSTSTVSPIIVVGPPVVNFFANPVLGCAPQVVTFTNASTGVQPANNYSWDFGNGNTLTGTGNPPPQTYGQGTWTITLVAGSACGSDTMIRIITVDTIPDVNLTVTPTDGCTPLTVTTTNTSTGGALSYQWYIDGILTYTSANIPPQVFTAPAGNNPVNHTIQLVVSNHCGVRDSLVTITVHPAVQAIFTPLNSTICQGQSVTFSQSSYGDQLTYAWDFGNGNTSTTAGPHTQTYNTAGTFTVSLIVNGFCGADTQLAIVTVNPMPVADIVPSVLSGCEDLLVNFTNNSTAGGTYTWNFGPNATPSTSTAFTPPAVNFTTPGSQQVTLVVSVLGCVSSDTVLIDVLPMPVPSFTAVPLTGCSPLSVTLTNTTTVAPGDVYTWDLGNGNTSSAQNPPGQTYIAVGNDSLYMIELVVTNSSGCADSISTTVTVHPMPVADIVPSVLSGCEDLLVNFTNNSTAGGTYSWNFGPNATPSTSTAFTPPAVNFTTPGSQQVTLEVNVLGCVNSDTVLIDVLPTPVPSFTAVPSTGCSPLSVTLTNTTTVDPGDIYAWDLGNGNTSSAQNPPGQTYIAVANDSTYTIGLVVTNSSGCADSVSIPVTVHPNPVAGFTMSADTVCALDNIFFTNTSTGINTYSWNFGDAGTSTTTSPAHSYANAGIYNVTLIATTAFGCADTISAPVMVDSIPTVAFTSSVECVGDSTLFTNSTTGSVATWLWNFGDATSSTAQTPNHLYATSGTYNVTLTATNNAGCSDAATQTVTVNTTPVAAFASTTVCEGQSTQFTDQTTGPTISWNWDFGDATTGTAQNPPHTYATAGTYTATLIAAAGSGCSDTITATVVVNPVPTAAFTSVAVCANDTMFFNSTSLGNPTIFSWDFGDGNTDNTNDSTPNHTYPNDGSYNVTLTAGYATGCANTIVVPVTVYPRTVPSFTSNVPCLGGPTNFTDATTNTPVNWTWDFGDGSPAVTTQNPSHTYANAGTYPVTLVTSNSFGCTDSILTNVQVYPLPVADFVADTVCEGFASAFADSSLFAVGWNWDFGDASAPGSAQNPTHTYLAQGTYNVTLVVTNASGCTDTIVQPIVVRPNPVSYFTASIACHTYATLYTDSSTAAIGWEWDFGDGSPVNTTQSPGYVFANPGTYNTSLVVSNVFGCTDTSAQQITVLPQPQAGFLSTVVCAEEATQFSDTSTGTPTQWTWDFGDGSPLDATQNPSHTYMTGGTYNVTLIAANPAGCIDTLVSGITVNTVPVPSFTATSVCLGNVTAFTDLSFDVVPITNYYWDFGDGNNSFQSNPNYIYQAPGTYIVTLTVTNGSGCDSTITIPVTVTGVPVAAFMADTVCVGSPTTFTDLSTGPPSTWFWDFGDGNTSTTGPVVQHTYANAGTYLASVIVSGGNGCTDQVFMPVTVSNTVQAAMTVNPAACTNDLVNFTDNSTTTAGNIMGWQWDFGDGSPVDTLQNTSHTYTTPGTYTITLTVSGSTGCASVATQVMTINPLPVAAFTATTACSNQQTQFTDNSAGGVTNWDWDFGDNTTSTVQNPSHQYTGNGIFNTTLIVTTAAGCMDTITSPVTVYSQPVAAFVTDTVCWGDTTKFTNQSTTLDGVIVSTNWDFADGNTSTLGSPEHSFTLVNDSFYVTLIVQTSYGCIDTLTQLVVTNPVPDMSFGPQVASGCEDFTVQLFDNTTVPNGNIVNWLWDFGDGNYSYAQNPVHTYNDDGQFIVGLTVTSADGCLFTDSLGYPIVVYPKPVADFAILPPSTSILTPDIEFIDESQGANFWEWDFGDFEGSILQNPSHTYADTGIYTVTQIVINQFGCRDTVEYPVEIKAEYTFFIPNAFSPNGNGNNDVFMGEGIGIQEFKMYVFDRWGNLIFESTDPNRGWDGKLASGAEAQIDAYVYKIYIRDVLGIDHKYIGHVSLVR